MIERGQIMKMDFVKGKEADWPTDGIEYNEHPIDPPLRGRLLWALFLLIAVMVVAFLVYGMATRDEGILAVLQHMMTATITGFTGWLLGHTMR
jgi:Co/Zn/Cd efflux system component